MINCTFENGNQASLRHVTANALVIKDEKILLAKRSEKLSTEPGKWCLLGGYINRDETTAEGVVREAREESGWEVADPILLRVVDSPTRRNDERQNIEFVYVVTAIEKAGVHDWESKELRWFSLDGLPQPDEMAFDHGDNIELYKRFLREPFNLPLVR